MIDDLPLFCPKCNRGLTVRGGFAFCHNDPCIKSGNGVWKLRPTGHSLGLVRATPDDFLPVLPAVRMVWLGCPPWMLTMLLAPLALILLVLAWRLMRPDLVEFWSWLARSFDAVP